MAKKLERVGIAGASSLVGKELAEELQESVLAAATVILLDEGDAAGQLETVADEVTFVQKMEPAAFEGMDFVFFAGDPEAAKRHWRDAGRWGASIVDTTYALEGEKGVLVRSPWVQDSGTNRPDLKTPGVVSAHPVAVMLGLIAKQLQEALKVSSLSATVLQPASEHGRPAMDELHQQTVNLLSFQQIPKDEYDAQVAFNLLPAFGEEAKVKLSTTAQRVRNHYAAIGGDAFPKLALTVIQAPVFHGYALSVMVDLQEAVSQEQLEAALACDQIDVVMDDADPPSNLSAAGQRDVLVRVTAEPGGAPLTTRFWLWMTADNLKLTALNAIACALELRKLRPVGSVQ
jgi:aspartate-semialdehyde dehydrogenase